MARQATKRLKLVLSEELFALKHLGSALGALAGRVEELPDGSARHLLKEAAIPAITAALAIVQELNPGYVERDSEWIALHPGCMEK